MNPLTQQTENRVLLAHELAYRADEERGITPLALDKTLLLKRVYQEGHSADFLGAAFISSYYKTNFQHSLGDLTLLDAEGVRLFHQILHIGFVKGQSDEYLYQIAQEIELVQNYNKRN